MERLKAMKEKLMSCVESQMGDLSKVNTEELGEVVDMIKDFAETIYYCTVTEAMEKREEEDKRMYYPMRYYTPSRMYSNAYDDGMRDYRNVYPKDMMRDYREGKSGEYRRMYMETKEMHEGKEKQMHELEKYLHELSEDVMDMISDATLEEKQILSQKLQTLAEKVR